jgi:hypothetical protein
LEALQESSNTRASMTQECLPGQKETTKKYRRIARMDQARMIQAVQSGQTQVAVAEENNVSRTTLEYWIKRMNEPIPLF